MSFWTEEYVGQVLELILKSKRFFINLYLQIAKQHNKQHDNRQNKNGMQSAGTNHISFHYSWICKDVFKSVWVTELAKV